MDEQLFQPYIYFYIYLHFQSFSSLLAETSVGYDIKNYVGEVYVDSSAVLALQKQVISHLIVFVMYFQFTPKQLYRVNATLIFVVLFREEGMIVSVEVASQKMQVHAFCRHNHHSVMLLAICFVHT